MRPPMNTVPNSIQETNDNNSSMFYGYPPEYHHQPSTNLGTGTGMSTPTPNYYHPYEPFYPTPPSNLIPPPGMHAVVDEMINPHFIEQGYKTKNDVVNPGYSQYPTTTTALPPPPPPPPPLSPPPAPQFEFLHYGTYPQLLDQISVRNRVGGGATMGYNNFIQGNFLPPPPPPPGSIWYDQQQQQQHSNGNSFLWPQQAPSSLPYSSMGYGGNVSFPRYHETSTSRNILNPPGPPRLYQPSNHYIGHRPPPPPPPPTVYPQLGFRFNQQYPQDDFAIHEYGEEDYYDGWDHHQDMRLDIEDMTYEELLALSDEIGTVKTGLSFVEVKDLLRKRTSLAIRINLEEAPPTDLETDSCIICQEIYNHQDKIATLDCQHEFHAECLKKWLVVKNVCPICKSEALVMEKKKKKKLRLSVGEE